MQARFFRTNSNVADLITSAGLLGNSLAKQEQDSQAEALAATSKSARRQHVSRSNSAATPALAALLGRTASSKQQPSQPELSTSKGSASQEAQSSAKPSLNATQPASSQPVTAGPATNLSNLGGVCINAAKPDLLAQTQALRLQEPLAENDSSLSAASHKQQADNQQGFCQEQSQAMAPGPTGLKAKDATAEACIQVLGGTGPSGGSMKPKADRVPSNDSIHGDADTAPTLELDSVPGSTQPQRFSSAGTWQRNKQSDEALQAAIREAQALASNANISRRKAERRAQKLDKELACAQSLLKQRDRQAEELQQQLEAATEASAQQKQSHQHTLTLLDQAHMEQLSQLQAQLLNQSMDESAMQSKLMLELADQSELTRQAQLRLSELEHECGDLQKKEAENQAVTQMLLKQQADAEAAKRCDEILTPTRPDVCSNNSHLQEDHIVANPMTMPSASIMADRTLVLEAEVLRRESKLLKEQLAKAEAAVQKLTLDRHEDKFQSSAKLSQLKGELSKLEGKHLSTAALLDQTLSAIQSKTAILLQQRPSGEGWSPADAATSSTQLSVLSKMNEQLASENAALIMELATVQRRLTHQAIQEGRQKKAPALVAGKPAKVLESLLSPPATAAAEQASSAASTACPMLPQSVGGRHEEVERRDDLNNAEPCSKMFSTVWTDAQSSLHQRTQQLDAQIELTQLRAKTESLKAKAAEAAARDLTKQGLIYTLQRQLRDADSEHQQEVKELRKAAKQLEKRAEQLSQQLPQKFDDSTVQAIREQHAKQRHVWASTKKTLQAQQSSLQDECNDLACQLAEQDQQLRCRDEQIMQLKKQLQEADLTVTSCTGSEAVASGIGLGSSAFMGSDAGNCAEAAPPERAPLDSAPSLDMPARLTLQRYRNEASAAKYEMNAALKELKRHKKESERAQLQQQLSIRSLKEQLAMAQQTLQDQVALYEAATARYEQQLRDVNAEKSSLQSQLQAADMHIHSTDTQLQASRLNMRYLKVRQQLSQTAPTLSYVQAYEVSCGLGSE